MPDTTQDSVATILAIMVSIIIVGSFYTGHLPFHMSDSDGGKVVSVHAQAPSQNSGDIEASMVLDSAGSIPAGLAESKPTPIPVTITTPKPEAPVESKESEDSPQRVQQEPIIAFIKQTFGNKADEAIQIAKCESGLRPDAVNHNTDSNQTIDYGLFQINNHWQEIDNTSFLFDYKINTLMAKKIFDNRGGNWSAWACATKLGL